MDLPETSPRWLRSRRCEAGACVEVAQLGAEARDAASTATAVALARQEGWLAAVPRTTAASLDLLDQEVTGVRLKLDVPIWLVTRGPRSAVLVDCADRLGDRMGLR